MGDMRRFAPARWLLASLVLAHFVILALNNLPSSRFVSALYPYYSWYPRFTGQSQNWAMYQYPDRIRADFELVATLPGGETVHPWGDSSDMTAREIYLLEGLLLRSDGHKLAHRFLDVLHARWRSTPKPQRIVLRRRHQTIYAFSDLPERGILSRKVLTREVERTW